MSVEEREWRIGRNSFSFVGRDDIALSPRQTKPFARSDFLSAFALQTLDLFFVSHHRALITRWYKDLPQKFTYAFLSTGLPASMVDVGARLGLT